MTTRTERTRAVIAAEAFLIDLMHAGRTPRVPHEFRERARQVLKHFPSENDILMAASGDTTVFGPPESAVAVEG